MSCRFRKDTLFVVISSVRRGIDIGFVFSDARFEFLLFAAGKTVDNVVKFIAMVHLESVAKLVNNHISYKVYR